MVDFKKRLDKKIIEKKIHPCEIYETLDRASDKGPLRPAQESVLNEWFDGYKNKRDIIVKLHTGQGKTLIGLLMLQSRINQNTGPAIYLCPDNYLIEQTCQQAESFGISYTTSEGDLPDDFIDGKSILVTTVSKIFNGITKFGLGNKYTPVSTIVMDDSHACIEIIKDACKITLKKDEEPYSKILSLFESELEKQGAGTLADIINKDYESFLPIPYWDWQDKHSEVVKILSEHKDLREMKFKWPILKDIIKDCQCIISGDSLEISPYITPLETFGSYFKAEHRIFMSATLTDDAFLIKGLGLDVKTIENPLCYKDEKWSGEKMILMPSLIDSSLKESQIIEKFAKPRDGRRYGIVVFTPSFKASEIWEKFGSTIAKKETIKNEIEYLKNKNFEKTLVIANRYDGIDLPDNSCRILIFYSKPYADTLIDRYLESCRSNSNVIAIKKAQTIEQGLGRGVRGEKDYCAIILTGIELIKFIRRKSTMKYFSQQTRMQIEIGLKIAEYAKEDIKSGVAPSKALQRLIEQLLERDDGWKEFYNERMNAISEEDKQRTILNIFESERKADLKYLNGDYLRGVEILQKIIDEYVTSDEDKGWYLQEMARFIHPYSKSESNKHQINAHKKNRSLFKPKEGMKITTTASISLRRIENIIKWIQNFTNFEELQIELDSILSHLRFGVRSDTFEKAFSDLGNALGFVTERPDKEWGEGPDNLWKVKDNQYLLVECKNKVHLSRNSITKDETGQMNNACAWFKRNYPSAEVRGIMIVPTNQVNKAGGFNEKVEIMRKRNLGKLTENVHKFFMEFKYLDPKDLPEKKIQELIDLHKLNVDNLLNDYSEKPQL